MKECVYTQIEELVWECSNCREWLTLNEGTKKDKRIKYCSFCGAKISKEVYETLEELIESMEEEL